MQGEDAFRSKPKGQDKNLATLKVVAPSGVKGTVTLADDFGTADAKTGDLLAGLQPHATTWRAKGSAQGVQSSIVGASNLASGQTTVATLAAVRAKFPSYALFGFESSGGTTSVGVLQQNAQLGPYDFDTQSSSIIIDKTATGTGAVIAAPGQYVFAWGFGDGIVVDAKAGKIADADLGSYAGRKMVRIVPPTRELPDGCSENHTADWEIGTTRLFLDSPTIIGQNEAAQRLARTITRQLAGWSPTPITVKLACTNKSIELPLGAEGAGPKDWKLGRVDVDDVEVTLTNGKKELRRGSYMVTEANDTTRRILTTWLPTNTGVDLPPGSYTLWVTYTNNVGEEASYTENFTTP